jgi:hypothetical protein
MCFVTARDSINEIDVSDDADEGNNADEDDADGGDDGMSEPCRVLPGW